MTAYCSKLFSTVITIIVFLASWALTIWIGVAMIVPQTPFKTRDIPTGVCLIVFSCVMALIAGIASGAITFVCCLPCSWCCDECIDDLV